jgi:hypothetical protein
MIKPQISQMTQVRGGRVKSSEFFLLRKDSLLSVGTSSASVIREICAICGFGSYPGFWFNVDRMNETE